MQNAWKKKGSIGRNRLLSFKQNHRWSGLGCRTKCSGRTDFQTGLGSRGEEITDGAAGKEHHNMLQTRHVCHCKIIPARFTPYTHKWVEIVPGLVVIVTAEQHTINDMYGRNIFTDYCSSSIRYVEVDSLPGGSNQSLVISTGKCICFGEDKYGELYCGGVGNGIIYKFSSMIVHLPLISMVV